MMDSESKFFNKNLLYFIPIIFILVIVFRITYAYYDVKHQLYKFAKEEAEVLNSYVMANRNYYQKLFIDKTIPLNEKTLHALPAYSSTPISKVFSRNNSLNIIVKTVSDRARNPLNNADEQELRVIEYFRNNSNIDEYFNDQDSKYYQYGYALRITKKCLTCHGKKSDAPEFIQKKYDKSYNYKLGEVRGIVSVKLPKDVLDRYFLKIFFYSIIYDIFLLLMLFAFIYYLINKSKKINTLLNIEVEEKTSALVSKNSFLKSYTHALNSSAAVTKTDINGLITYANDKFLADTGYERDEVIGRTHVLIKHPDTDKKTIKDMWNTIKSKNIWTHIIKGLRKDKSTFISKVSITPVIDANDEIIEFIAARIDITELVGSKNKLEKTIITDSLTNLPNRQKLIDDIYESEINKEESLHLALFNIDSFKEINDFYGYVVADKVLRSIATKLETMCVDNKGSIYKLPSDEYAIFTTLNMSTKEFLEHIQKVTNVMSRTKYEVDDNIIPISFSVGVASNCSSIMVKADMALQKAKDDKKQTMVSYDDSIDMAKKIAKNIESVSLLKSAIDRKSIIPFFQPIYNIKTKKIEKYECLARIILEDGTIIPPFGFLDVAIKSRLYPYITKYIISNSFDFFKDKKHEFSINISMEDVVNEETVEFIIDSLNKFENPSRVVFEILESEEIDSYIQLKEFIKKVKVFGCKIAIDDFGSGYSNFAHILELKIDYLKIDASLVRHIIEDENSRKITQTIINFAKDLNLKTIAEYVENKESLALLEEMGSDYVQGYYIGKPESFLQD